MAASIARVASRSAGPPHAGVNFTPLYSGGLWLAVIVTAPGESVAQHMKGHGWRRRRGRGEHGADTALGEGTCRGAREALAQEAGFVADENRG